MGGCAKNEFFGRKPKIKDIHKLLSTILQCRTVLRSHIKETNAQKGKIGVL